MNLTLRSADSASITPENTGHGHFLKVEIDGVSESDILDQIPIQEAIDYYGIDKLLDAIGRDETVIHFDLSPEEEQ